MNFLKKHRKWIMRAFFAIAIAASFLGGCSYVNQRFGLEDDNFIESYIEDVIESRLGLPDGSVDLTPEFDSGKVRGPYR